MKFPVIVPKFLWRTAFKPGGNVMSKRTESAGDVIRLILNGFELTRKSIVLKKECFKYVDKCENVKWHGVISCTMTIY